MIQDIEYLYFYPEYLLYIYIYTYAVCISSMCVPDSARQISAYETKTKE